MLCCLSRNVEGHMEFLPASERVEITRLAGNHPSRRNVLNSPRGDAAPHKDRGQLEALLVPGAGRGLCSPPRELGATRDEHGAAGTAPWLLAGPAAPRARLPLPVLSPLSARFVGFLVGFFNFFSLLRVSNTIWT